MGETVFSHFWTLSAISPVSIFSPINLPTFQHFFFYFKTQKCLEMGENVFSRFQTLAIVSPVSKHLFSYFQNQQCLETGENVFFSFLDTFCRFLLFLDTFVISVPNRHSRGTSNVFQLKGHVTDCLPRMTFQQKCHVTDVGHRKTFFICLDGFGVFLPVNTICRF